MNSDRRKRTGSDDIIIASVPSSKRTCCCWCCYKGKAISLPEETQKSNSADNPISRAPVRRDSIHRRVSTSADQTTLDLEDELFSPTVKIGESTFLCFGITQNADNRFGTEV